MDRISNLSDDIICHIVSYASAKEAAFVSVLSKRFQNVFGIIETLKYHGSIQESFKYYVNAILALPASTRVNKFSLKCGYVSPSQYNNVNRCILAVLKHGLLDLEVDLDLGKQYTLPQELFTCKTLIKLKVGKGFVICVLPTNASLPVLETLVLDLVWFHYLSGCPFEKLLRACHVLKELIIYNMEWECWTWSGNVSSPTLERLTIHHGDVDQFGYMSIAFNTPKLTYLELCDVVPDEYRVVNMESLVEAKLDLLLLVNYIYELDDIGAYDHITSNPTNLFKGLKNVQIMTLINPSGFQALYYFHEAFPVFEKLHQLTMTTYEEDYCWQFLPFLLWKAPNLETLIIDGPLHYKEGQVDYVCKCMLGYLFLLSCPIKVLEIRDYRGTTQEAAQLKYYMWKLPNLRTVKLNRREPGNSLNVPRGPSTCEIKVTFS